MKRRVECIDIFLQPGEYFVGDKNYRIRTLLGSCVSMTLWHPRYKIGAMSHFLLSKRLANPEMPHELDGRYGEEAMRLMLNELEKLQIKPSECEGKIFGGGNMFPGHKRSAQLIGQANGETARWLLRSHHIPIISESLYGYGHRQIYFDVFNGDVWELQIKPSDQP